MLFPIVILFGNIYVPGGNMENINSIKVFDIKESNEIKVKSLS